MTASIKRTIEECARNSYAGTVGFGDVVRALMQAGVESYHADYRRSDTTYYMPDGAAHTIALHRPESEIPKMFNPTALQSAIRGAQRGEVKYPEFLKLSMAAGCIGYIVWIAGRHVAYFGRGGELHIEHFPASD